MNKCHLISHHWSTNVLNKESQLALFLTSSEGMSRGRLYITLAALQCMDSKESNSFLFVQQPQIGNAYVTKGEMTLEYRY